MRKVSKTSLGTLLVVGFGWAAVLGSAVGLALFVSGALSRVPDAVAMAILTIIPLGFVVGAGASLVGTVGATGNLVRLWLAERTGQKRWAAAGLLGSLTLVPPTGLALAAAAAGVAVNWPLAVGALFMVWYTLTSR